MVGPRAFIAVSGNIGVGKTTLVGYLCERYGLKPVFEPFADNPYLDDFYVDMQRWAFHSQSWFLAHKFRLHQELQASDGPWIQDRTIYEDAQIFATHLARTNRMTARDFATYEEMYRAMRSSLRPPDLLIHLHCSVRAIRRRVKQRGRASEQNIPAAYLRRLNDLYEEWIAGWTDSPVIRWDTEKQDWLGDLVHRIDFHKAIEVHLDRVAGTDLARR